MESMDLFEILESLVHDSELMLVDLSIKRVGRSNIIRILVDRPGRVTISECARLSRAVKDRIDGDMLMMGENYRLEVGSPGIGRLLHSEVDWKRTVGRKLSVELEDDSFSDWLDGYDGEVLIFRNGRTVPVDAVRRALEVLDDE